MRQFKLLIGLLAACSPSTAAFSNRDYDRYDYYAVHIDPSAVPDDVARHLGLELDGKLGELDDHYLLRKERHAQNIVAETLREHRRRKKRSLEYRNSLLDSVLFHDKQVLRPPHEKRGPIYPYMPRPRQLSPNDIQADEPQNEEQKEAREKGREIAKALKISDPIYETQWHLYNYMEPGHDLNVTGLWQDGITGKGSTVCIVDDGLDMDSEDIKDNYFAEGSYDFNDKSEEPRPRLADDRHGTRCAGEVSAVKNDVCGVGVAWDSKVAGIRILSKPITDADEAVALNYGYQKTQIYSCSWGPPDDGTQMGAPGVLIKRAMLNAIQKGRGGLGTIYVFAAGNGAASEDNCNFDGYTNSIYSITVGAIDWTGKHPYYSEKCSAQLIVTYSSGSGDAIHTTDVGDHKCVGTHGGTSAAGPLAVGVYALALQVRPDLTWRDLQWLTVLNAVEVNRKSDWQNTTVGKRFSHQFGFGKLDAGRLVEAARDFKSVKAQAWYFSPWQHVDKEIPQGTKGLSSKVQVTKKDLKEANLERVEHVTVKMNIDHTCRGDLSVDLISPSGVVSHISTTRRRDTKKAGYINWTFMSVAHWGESGIGKWTVIVKDTVENDSNGTFIDWKLNLWGESIDPDQQALLPLPTKESEADDGGAREAAEVTVTSVEVTSQSELPTSLPSDHQHRPINVKPTTTPALTKTSVVSPADEAIATSQPGNDSNNNNHNNNHNNNNHHNNNNNNHNNNHHKGNHHKPKPNQHGTPDNFLPSPFPNFGVSKRTQIWIYGASGLIIMFCVGLSIYFWTARKKRQRALARDTYEFEIIDEEDDDDEGGDQMNGAAGGKKTKRRAGELYDAFAGESDEEMFSDEDDELENRYRDRENPNREGSEGGDLDEKKTTEQR